MGCSVSRIDANGMAFPARLRPIIPDISVQRRNRATKLFAMSKKKLLSRKSDSSEGSKVASSSPEDSVGDFRKFLEPQQAAAGIPDDEASAEKNGIGLSIGNEINGIKYDISSEIVPTDNEYYTSEEVFMDADDGDEDDDDNDRMIGHVNNQAFIGSPSFRIYYQDNSDDELDEIGKNDSFKDAVPYNDGVTPKVSFATEEKKSTLSRKKRRSFKKVFPKGRQVKSLLSMKSCYSSPHASHDRSRLLREE